MSRTGPLSELGPDRQVAHVELEVLEPAKAPLPVTQTGYRSHFLPPEAVQELGGPVGFVRAWLDQEAQSPGWRKARSAWEQLDLFGL